MRYSWDAEKNRWNRAKHRISFEDAISIFNRPVVERIDDRFDYGEERIRALGRLGTAIIVVIYVEQHEEERRIISARRATSAERQEYFEATDL